MNKIEKGFAHPWLIILITVVILTIGFIGWRVYNNNESKPATFSDASSKPNANQKKPEISTKEVKSKIPSNYTTYENKDVGFKFSYPKEWGVIVCTGNDTPELITNGLNGHPLRTMFENGDQNVLPRGNYLSGDNGPGTDEGHYGGGYIQEGDKYYSIAKYTADKTEIPAERILAKAQSELGTVLIINASMVAGNRIQLLLNLPTGKTLAGLDLVFTNSNEDFADESQIDATGLETLKTVAQTFEAL